MGNKGDQITREQKLQILKKYAKGKISLSEYCDQLGLPASVYQRMLEEKEKQRENSKIQSYGNTRARKEFIVSTCHEMRTPLNGLLCFSDLLLESNLDQEPRKYLEAIKSESFSILELINKEQNSANRVVHIQKARRRFIRDMIHGTKMPLNRILGFCELLLESKLGQEQHEFAQGIKSSCVSFIKLINDQKDFLRELSRKTFG